ncbi:hypothetical protein ACA910_020648 [Epithemia clementina (nom. ined.)]
MKGSDGGMKGYSAPKPLEMFPDTTTVSTTPFSLAGDYDFEHTSRSGASDNISVTEGIDVVAAAPTPETFEERISVSTGRIVRSQPFKRLVLGAILMNAICMGAATVPWVQEHHYLFVFVNTSIYSFRVLFTMELFLSIGHYQTAAFYNGWIVLDVVVISLSWFVSLSLLVLRAFRLIRALRKASGVAELNHLVEALLQVIPKMSAVLFLIGLVFYMFAVIFTDLYQYSYNSYEVSYNYFGRIDRSAFTLFQIMTLDGWAVIANELMSVYPWSGLLIVLFILLTSFFFGALVIAVMGEGLTNVANMRLLKALEEDHNTPLAKSTQQQEQQIYRLESTIQKLSNTVDRLLASQLSMQEALKQLSQEGKKI